MREMRRFKQLMSEADTIKVFEDGTHGVMAIMADDDYPYAVPVNYWFDKEHKRIYFHGAKAGMKIDAMDREDKCSFCVVDLDENDPEHYSTNFRSAIAFGSPRLVYNDTVEYNIAIKAFTEKYVKCYTEEEIDAQLELEKPTCLMCCIDIDFMTGKEAKELVALKQEEAKKTYGLNRD